MKKQKKDSLKELGEIFYKTRSEKAFTELYNRIRPGLFNYVNKILNKPEDSDYVISQIMTTVYDKIDKYDPKWNISTWIYRIAYTHACMELRYRKAEKTTPLSYFEKKENKNLIHRLEFESIENQDPLIVQEEIQKDKLKFVKIHEALNKLPEEYRTVIQEKFFNNLRYDEISKKLNIPLHTVKNRINRGKKIIKEIYETL